ncbi:helix-turn-helix domain-containing protein [Blautia schinkii]
MAALNASGYSTAEIADALGVSSSTVSKYLNGKE